MQFIEKQLLRMRKKEEMPVQKRGFGKRLTNNISAYDSTPSNPDPNNNRPSTTQNASYQQNGLGMNIRSRVK